MSPQGSYHLCKSLTTHSSSQGCAWGLSKTLRSSEMGRFVLHSQQPGAGYLEGQFLVASLGGAVGLRGAQQPLVAREARMGEVLGSPRRAQSRQGANSLSTSLRSDASGCFNVKGVGSESGSVTDYTVNLKITQKASKKCVRHGCVCLWSPPLRKQRQGNVTSSQPRLHSETLSQKQKVK